MLRAAKQLRLLDLSFNFLLEVDAASVETIKAMPSLRELDMRKVGAPTWNPRRSRTLNAFEQHAVAFPGVPWNRMEPNGGSRSGSAVTFDRCF